MTALTKYARLEATALWRNGADAQRREVVVSIGEATLVITDLRTNSALTHWSLAAIERKTNGIPAVFHPDGDPDETLELGQTETEMIEAIDTLRRAVAQTRPHPGRLRWLGAALSISAVAALAFFWLPGALRDHTLRVLPDVKRMEITQALLSRIERASGPACTSRNANRALRALAERTNQARIIVIPGGIMDALLLPDGTMLVHKSLVETHEDPHVVAGYILAESTRHDTRTVLGDVLSEAGLRGTATLLTTGQLPDRALDAHARQLIAQPDRILPDTDALLARFAETSLSSRPYALAKDPSGETTLALIEADPTEGTLPEIVMADADWLRLQNICER